jgi:Protein of unknown function (DUF1236)
MRRHCAIAVAIATLPLATGATAYAQSAGVEQSQKLELTAAQRSAIYAVASKDRSKVSPQHFPAEIGAAVPPMINLYALPDDIVAGNPSAKLYEYTMVQDKVVLVDPTKMRVIDTIGPQR